MQQTGSNLDNEMIASVKKTKKKSSKPEEETLSVTNVGNNPNAVATVDSNTEMTKKKKKKKSARGENETQGVMNVEEIGNSDPKNHFNSIWNADVIGKSNQGLGTIPEQPRIVRTKSYLGGKVAKLDEEHISNLSNVQDANAPITYKKSRSKEMNSNEEAGLVDEFNKAQSSSSSIGH